MEINDLERLLKWSWSRLTCAPSWRNKWKKDIPSLGQCAITALIVNDFYGGKIMRTMTSLGSHYYNMVDDKIIDLTSDQFLNEKINYDGSEERTREYLLSNEDTKQRYLLLKSNLYRTIEEEEQLRNDNSSIRKDNIVIQYFDYDNLNIDDELDKIQNCDKAEIVLELNNKMCLFILGMLFANGVKIKLLNEKELHFEQTNKSFPLMVYVWSKLGDNHFPSPDCSNVVSEMDMRIENIKRLGVTPSKIIDNPIDNKIFLICPVRNASLEQKQWIENFVKQKVNEGYIIHAPHLHTRQVDMFGGYAICKQNAEALASSSEVDIFYDQSSTGSVFDLGVSYALNKPLVLLNQEELILSEDDYIDKLISNWPFNEQVKSRQLTI